MDSFRDGFVDSFNVPDVDRFSDLQRGRDLGKLQPGVLGLADREFCVLGGYWPRWNFDLCDFVSVPTKLANQHQPSRRGDDDLRGYLRGDLPRDSRRSRLAGFLVASLPQFELVDVAAIPKPSSLGRFCGRNLCIDFLGVLVHGDDSRFGNLPRSQQDTVASFHLRFVVFGLDGFIEALAGLRKGLHASGRVGRTAGSLGSHGR